jgi:hypothetical protein
VATELQMAMHELICHLQPATQVTLPSNGNNANNQMRP